LQLPLTFLHKKTKSNFQIADGIPADVIERIDPPSLKADQQTRWLARAYVGGEKDVIHKRQLFQPVGYNSLLTGTWVNKHNVWDNDIAAPNYNYWNIYRFLKHNTQKNNGCFFNLA
jgi:hypothetical protein